MPGDRLDLPHWSTVEIPQIKGLQSYLQNRVIGQRRAVDNIVRSFSMGLAGLQPSQRPFSVLFFAGPTGVGKTEMALALADYLYQREKKTGRKYKKPPLVQVDSELFSGSLHFGISKLIGAPPPYIGSRSDKESPVEPLFAQKNFPKDRVVVLLFDEVEKAFGGADAQYQGSEMLGILMAMLDKGELYNHWDDDEPVNFRKTMIVFTSNIGAREIAEVGQKKVGFFDKSGKHLSDDEVEKRNKTIYESTRVAYNRFFPPELRNRIDRLVVFRFLTRNEFSRILEKEFTELRREFAKSHNLTITISSEVTDWLLMHGVVREEGVRSLQRAITRKIRNPLSVYLNASVISEGNAVAIKVEDFINRDAEFEFYLV